MITAAEKMSVDSDGGDAGKVWSGGGGRRRKATRPRAIFSLLTPPPLAAAACLGCTLCRLCPVLSCPVGFLCAPTHVLTVGGN